MTATFTAIGESYSPAQIEAATQLIDDGGLVIGPRGVCVAVSSDGARTYVVDPGRGSCTCTAGMHGRRCYHLASAQAVVGPVVFVLPTPAPVPA